MSTKKTSQKPHYWVNRSLVFVMAGVFCFSYALETLDVKAEELGASEQPIYEPPFPDYSIVVLKTSWVP